MPYKTFNNWLFDGKNDTPIPKPKTDDSGKILIPDILKYNSPITQTFVIEMFLKNPLLNHYLNRYFNNINLRYLNREELFLFIKKCVQDFKIQKSQIMFYPRQPSIFLYEKLRERMALLKNDDIYLLCDIIDKSNEKEAIYNSLGVKSHQKSKLKTEKKIIKEKISCGDFLEQHFSTIEV